MNSKHAGWRRFAVLAGAAIFAALAALAPAAAEASPAESLAAGCRAAPYSASFSIYFETEAYNDLGVYTTTSQCNDINIRSTGSAGFKVCVIFTKVGNCNYTTTVPPSGQWVNAATNVRDGTTFYLRLYKGGANYVYRAGDMDF